MTDETIQNDEISPSLRLRQYQAINDAVVYRILFGNPVDNMMEILSELMDIGEQLEEDEEQS